LHLAAELRPDPLGELTALPRPLASSIKGGGGARDGNEREAERKGITRSKEKREIKEKGGKLGIMEYVFRIVEVRYWQPYRVARLKMSSASPLKKAGAATAYCVLVLKNDSRFSFFNTTANSYRTSFRFSN